MAFKSIFRTFLCQVVCQDYTKISIHMTALFPGSAKFIRIEQLIIGSIILLGLTPLIVDTQGYSTYRVPKYIYFSSIYLVTSIIVFFLRKQVRQIIYNAYSLTFLGLICCLCVTQYWAFDRTMSLNSTFNRMEGVWYHLSLILLFFIGSAVSLSNKNWSLIFYCWTGVAIFITLGGFIADKGYIQHYRLSSTLGNPSSLAHYLLCSIALLILAIDSVLDLKRYYYVFIPSFIVLLAGIGLTFTRTTYIELILSLIIYGLLRGRTLYAFRLTKGRWVVAVAGCLLAISVFAIVNYRRFIQLVSNVDTIRDRVRLWKIAYAGINERPVTGWGMDNFIYVFDKYQPAHTSTVSLVYDRSHNVFLDWFIHGGVLAGCGYIVLWIMLLLGIRRTTLTSHKKAVLVAWWFSSVFFLFLNIDNLTNWLFLIIISLYVLTNLPPSRVSFIANKYSLFAFSIGALIYSFCLFVFNLKPITNEYCIARQFDTDDYNKKLFVLKKLVGKESPANFTMSTPIYDYFYEVSQSDLPSHQKAAYHTLAIDFIKQQIENKPPSVYLLGILAGMYTQLKNYESAIRIYNTIIKINPVNALPHYQLGHLFFSLDQYQKAYLSFSKAEKIAPAFGEATLLKIRMNALLDTAYDYEPDLMAVPADVRTKNAHLVGDIFRVRREYSRYVYWMWKGGFPAETGATPLILYEFATSAYAAGDMTTFGKVLTMYSDNFECSPAFAVDMLALVERGIDPSDKLWTYKNYRKKESLSKR
jgi:O-antigen ligase/tetratricopeptide (TPR) repeat protein